MRIFVRCTRNSSPWYVSYQGQSQETITTLLTDLGASDIEFISESEYQSAIEE